MSKPMTFKLDEKLTSALESRAKSLNLTVTNYVEMLIKNDIAEFEECEAYAKEINRADRPLTVYAPVKINKRMIAEPQREGESAEAFAKRQECIDVISRLSGWDGKK